MKELNDISIKCAECDQEFNFSGKITAELMTNVSIEKAEELLQMRTELVYNIEKLKREGKNAEVQRLTDELNVLERMIISCTNGSNLETYEFFGYEQKPKYCPECRENRKAKAAERNASKSR